MKRWGVFTYKMAPWKDKQVIKTETNRGVINLCIQVVVAAVWFSFMRL